MQFIEGSTRALACSDRRPRRSALGLAAFPERRALDVAAGVFRGGAENRTRGRVRSPFQRHGGGLSFMHKRWASLPWREETLSSAHHVASPSPTNRWI